MRQAHACALLQVTHCQGGVQTLVSLVQVFAALIKLTFCKRGQSSEHAGQLLSNHCPHGVIWTASAASAMV